jgi:hypothetical protein
LVKSSFLTIRRLFLAIFAVLLAAHLCHFRVLWAEEDLPLAAARQILSGETLYRGIWFDKPPLVPLVYLLWGAKIGVVGRIAGAAYGTLVCWLAFAVSRALWSDREGRWSAGLMAFFLTFDTASSVMPLAADSLLLAPHLAAILFAIERRPVWSGIFAGIGFLFNAKAVFVAAACVVFALSATPMLVAGFALPCAIAAGMLASAGAWQPYLDQVWIWPAAYARNTFVADPLRNGFLRTANWTGFHLALVVAGVRAFIERPRRWQLAAWGILSLAGVALGWRFFPRYYFQLLPFAVVVAGRGMTLLGRRWWLPAILLLIPLARFGPRYAILAANGDPQWSDVAMDRESRDAAAVLNRFKRPGDTLFVWGFRPDLFPYTGMPAASRYLDCQAMTGVPADRHLTQSESVLPAETTAQARRELARSHPDFIVDGLSEYNPRLAIASYGELKAWFAGYREIARVRGIVIYQAIPRRGPEN